jgi:hypothetical protein
MRLGKGTGTPLDINIKELLAGVALLVVSLVAGLVAPVGGVLCFLVSIGLILHSIDRKVTHRAGLCFFAIALVVLGIGLRSVLCQ